MKTTDQLRNPLFAALATILNVILISLHKAPLSTKSNQTADICYEKGRD
ncbi:hypothetical protein ACR777_16565 [Sphingobacterium spiritivorum]